MPHCLPRSSSGLGPLRDECEDAATHQWNGTNNSHKQKGTVHLLPPPKTVPPEAKNLVELTAGLASNCDTGIYQNLWDGEIFKNPTREKLVPPDVPLAILQGFVGSHNLNSTPPALQDPLKRQDWCALRCLYCLRRGSASSFVVVLPSQTLHLHEEPTNSLLHWWK